MYYHQSMAAKGQENRHRHLQNRSVQRAAVNIFKTENSFEILVFAPGRIKEHFQLDVKGDRLTVSYLPPNGFPSPEWLLREYSRGGFERTFALDPSVDSANIQAKYADGVLQVTLPVIAGEQTPERKIQVN